MILVTLYTIYQFKIGTLIANSTLNIEPQSLQKSLQSTSYSQDEHNNKAYTYG